MSMPRLDTMGGAARTTLLLEGGWQHAGRYLTPEMNVTLPRGAAGGTLAGWKQGAPQRTAPGVQIGRAFAGATRDGARFVETGFFAADAILAELDTAGRVHVLERVGARLKHAQPWIVGRNITVLPNVPGPAVGIVVRGASIGAGALNDHYFLPLQSSANGPIILHHRAPNPPANSTVAFDPDGNGIKARLSDSLRISGGLDRSSWCQGATRVAPKQDWWVYINGTRSGGVGSGWIPVTFAGAESVQSSEVGGPLTHCSQTHEFGYTHERRPLRLGAWFADAIITRGSPVFEAPAEWLDQEEPPVAEPQGHPVRVWCMVDNDVKHGFLCGPRKGLRRWHTRQPIEETPPCTPTKGPITGDKKRTYPSLPQAYMAGGPLAATIAFMPTPRAR